MPAGTVDRGTRSVTVNAARVIVTVSVCGLAVAGTTLLRGGLPDLKQHATRLVERLSGRTAPSSAPSGTVASERRGLPHDLGRLHRSIAADELTQALALIARYSPQDLNRVHEGMTALTRAASRGEAKLVERIIVAGGDPNVRGSQQRTALQYATEKNHIRAARLLLDAGADIDGVDSSSLSPLIMAADRGHTELALMLIRRGANVNIQHVEGWTALMDAARTGNAKLARALLDAGASTGARHRSGSTALDFARAGRHAEVQRLLLGHGKTPRRARADPIGPVQDTETDRPAKKGKRQ